MKKSVVYSSNSGNTKLLAEAIAKVQGVEAVTVKEANTDADVVYVGFWTQAFSCSADVKAYLESLNNKKVFLFGTAGYNFTEEFYNGILDAVKENVNDSNEIIGTFMCQGEVSEKKQGAIKAMDEAKFESMKENIDKAANHPNQDDLTNLISVL